MVDLEKLAELHSHAFSHLPFDCGSQANPGITDTEEWRDWTARKTTPDQLRIEDYLSGFDLAGKRILHVGVGNSGLAERFAGRAEEIFGTTVVDAEADHGNGLALCNYRVIVHNKYSGAGAAVPSGFHFIVDNNPTTFCCCVRHLAAVLDFYRSHLAKGGQVLSDRAGLAWATDANPGWGFSLEELGQIAALCSMRCYRINYETFVIAEERPPKPSIAWRAMIGLRSLARRAERRVLQVAGRLARPRT